MNSASRDFPKLLKFWREKAKASQLELALRCDVSQKHISFLELGRTSPSRSMVLVICDALDIALRERNILLMAAGFAAAYRESDLSAPELAEAEQALTMMLDQHEPYPAVVVDRLTNIVRANNGSKKLQMWLYDCNRSEDLPAIAGNFLRGMFSPSGYRQHVKNWKECARSLLRGIPIEDLDSISPDIANVLRSRSDLMDSLGRQMSDGWLQPLLTINLEKDGEDLNFFSTSTTLSAPLNVTLEEIHLRSMFPVDDATRRFFVK